MASGKSIAERIRDGELRDETKAGQPPATLSISQEGEAILQIGALPLLVESMQAVNVPKPGGKDDETVPAYDVTFKSVIPEHLLVPLVAAIREHRVVVRILSEGEVRDDIAEGDQA